MSFTGADLEFRLNRIITSKSKMVFTGFLLKAYFLVSKCTKCQDTNASSEVEKKTKNVRQKGKERVNLITTKLPIDLGGTARFDTN